MNHFSYHFGGNSIEFSPRFISYDSEFVREKSYIPRLALVQLHQPNNQSVSLHDPLNTQYTPPWSALLTHNAPIVMHSGNQDLELIYLNTGTLPKSYRDTQLGFSLIHPKQFISYADIVEFYLGITLAKEQTRSNWLKRPLSREQLQYAANDVSYLSQLYPLLCADLQKSGRLMWWQEDCQRMLVQAKKVKKSYRWYRLSAAPQLKGIETAIASVLVDVREVLAERYNLPRRQITSDKEIIQLAKKHPDTIEKLAEILPADHTLWQALPELTQHYDSLSTLTEYPVIPKPPKLTSSARKNFEKLLKHTQLCAKQLNIAPDTLISNKQLRYFCANPQTESPITRGWRAQFYENILNKLK